MIRKKKSKKEIPKAALGQIISGAVNIQNKMYANQKERLDKDEYGNIIENDNTRRNRAVGSVFSPIQTSMDTFRNNDLDTSEKLKYGLLQATGFGGFVNKAYSGRLEEIREGNVRDSKRDEALADVRNNQLNYQRNIPTFQMGGRLPQQQGMPMDEGFDETNIDNIEGNKHERGGTNISNIVEGEEGETLVGDYIFSDEIKITDKIAKNYSLPDKYIGKTIAEVTKDIKEKYSLRENDTFDEAPRSEELEALKQIQETEKDRMFKKDLNKMVKEHPEMMDQLMNSMQGPQGQEQMQGQEQITQQIPQDQAQVPINEGGLPQMRQGGFVLPEDPPGSILPDTQGGRDWRYKWKNQYNPEETFNPLRTKYNSPISNPYVQDYFGGNNGAYVSLPGIIGNQREGEPNVVDVNAKIDNSSVNRSSTSTGGFGGASSSTSKTNINSDRIGKAYSPENPGDMSYKDIGLRKETFGDVIGDQDPILSDSGSTPYKNRSANNNNNNSNNRNGFNVKAGSNFMSNLGNYYSIGRGILEAFRPDKQLERVDAPITRVSYMDPTRAINDTTSRAGINAYNASESSIGSGQQMANKLLSKYQLGNAVGRIAQRYDETNNQLYNRANSENAQRAMQAASINLQQSNMEEEINTRRKDVASNEVQKALANMGSINEMRRRERIQLASQMGMIEAMNSNDYEHINKDGMIFIKHKGSGDLTPTGFDVNRYQELLGNGTIRRRG